MYPARTDAAHHNALPCSLLRRRDTHVAQVADCPFAPACGLSEHQTFLSFAAKRHQRFAFFRRRSRLLRFWVALMRFLRRFKRPGTAPNGSRASRPGLPTEC